MLAARENNECETTCDTCVETGDAGDTCDNRDKTGDAGDTGDSRNKVPAARAVPPPKEAVLV